MLYVVLGAIGLLIFLAFYLFIGSSKKSTVLITGICDAGKTCLLLMLVHKKTAMTFTSLAPNVETYVCKVKSSKRFTLVDVPGLEKLRFECVNKHKSGTVGVIFVINSVDIKSNLKDVAEYLFDLMTDATLARSRTPFLILCNKTDLPGAMDTNSIEQTLEAELTMLCRTKADALVALGGHSEARVPLVKKPGDKFVFAECKHHAVTFADCSVISSDVGPVRLWLERL